MEEVIQETRNYKDEKIKMAKEAGFAWLPVNFRTAAFPWFKSKFDK